MFFCFLSIYDFYNIDYVMGLVVVYQLIKCYEKVVEFYFLVFVLVKDDYCLLFYVGQCNLMLKKSSVVLYCFESIFNGSDDLELK